MSEKNIRKRFLPVAGWMTGYPREWLRPDLLAGVTTAAVVIPKAMAYATIAGLPVEVGLYTAFIPMVIYAILGTSRPLSVSTTSTIAILAAANLAMLIPEGDPARLVVAASTLASMVGIFLLLAGILRLGFIANFISDPVLTGFKAGISLVIMVDQVPKLLGIHFGKSGFFHNIFSIFQHLPETSIATLVIALTTLALMIGLEHFRPSAPASLFAVALGIAASGTLGLGQAGVELAGRIPAGLPAPVLPDLSMVGKLWPGALGIALMAFAESIAAGRAFIRQGDPRPPSNGELVALGTANLVGSFFRIMPAGGGTSQTAVNDKTGARSQAAELVTAGVVLAVLLFLSPLVSLLPQATLAAVVVTTTAPLLNLKDFRDIFRPVSDEQPSDETFPGLLIMRTEGRMTFASTPRVGERFWELVREEQPRVLVRDCSAIPDIEYTALNLLIDAEEKLKQAGTTLWLAALNPGALEVVKRSTLGRTLGDERMFFNVAQALETYLRKSVEKKVDTETRADGDTEIGR